MLQLLFFHYQQVTLTKDKEPPERWLFWNSPRRSLMEEAYLDSRMEAVENIAW